MHGGDFLCNRDECKLQLLQGDHVSKPFLSISSVSGDEYSTSAWAIHIYWISFHMVSPVFRNDI